MLESATEEVRQTELSAEAGGPVGSDPQFRADLDAEVEERQADIEDFVVYPVLSLGLCFRLGSGATHAARPADR